MRLAFLFGFLIFFLHVHHYCVHVTDDSFIFFRYAENIVDGYGIRWNEGQEPVEGFSSPLWLGILSLGIFVGIPVVLFSKIMGVVCLMATALLLIWFDDESKGKRYLSPLLFLFCGSVFYWGMSGMETPLYTLCFLGTFAAISHPRFVFFAPMMALCRPEGVFLLLPWSVAWWVLHKERRSSLVWIWALPVGYLVFRLFYFGQWLPNTYYAKVGASIGERLYSGISYSSPIILCLFPLGWALRKESSVLLWALFSGVIGECILVVAGGGDWMNWGRLLNPMLPPLLLLCCTQIRKGEWVVLLSLVFLYPFYTPPKAWISMLQGETLPTAGFQEGGLHNTSKKIAEDIRANLLIGSTIAINHAGFLPYYLPEYRFIDMTGLNDAHIAHNTTGGLHQKYDPEYVLSKTPDLILLNSRFLPSKEPFLLQYWGGGTALYEHPRFATNYSVVPGYYERKSYGGGTAYVLLFQRYSNTD